MPKNKNRGTQPSPVTETETVTQQRPAHIDNGDDARGAVNARENQTSTQPEPSPIVTALGEDGISDKVVSLRARGPLEMRRHALSETGAAKHAILTDTKQQLSQAADLFAEGGEKAKEGRKLLETLAPTLYIARKNGTLSADELSSLLGDTFGWKAKKGDKEAPVKGGDPDASKTPFGYGEATRKRVVRAVQAAEYVAAVEAGREINASKFFDGLPVEPVKEALARVEANQLSLWSAYDKLGDIKREASEGRNAEPAFDPKRIAKIAESLRRPDAPQRLLDNPALLDAYLGLHDMIVVVDREAAILMRAANKSDAA